MSNENLNDFYNQNRFNKKLRERIDAYEPELSDSLWDRIEHDLVEKESKGKKAVWMVYVLAGLLLVSAAGIYYLADQNQKLAEAVKEKETTNEVLKSNPIPADVYQMPETTVEVERIVSQPTESIEEPSASTIVALTPEPIRDQIESSEPVIPVRIEYLDSENTGAGLDGSETPIADIPTAEPINTTDALSISGKELEPFTLASKTRFVNPIQENIINKGAIDPRIMPYFGISSDFGSTRQNVSGPTAARFNHEHPLVYKSNGLEIGLQLRNGLFFESGLRFSQTGSNLWYDFTPSTELDTFPIGNPSDSLIAGSRHKVNQQNWIEIPVQIGYRYSLTSKWSVTGQTGLTYSMINSYSGVEPTESFQALDKAGASEAQPFKNYWSLNLGMGVGYQLGRNWMFDIQGNYRRGLQDLNAVSRLNHPNRRAEILNARIGIHYLIR